MQQHTLGRQLFWLIGMNLSTSSSPQCSPNNSKVEEEEELEEEEKRTGLVFGDDDSEDKDK